MTKFAVLNMYSLIIRFVSIFSLEYCILNVGKISEINVQIAFCI